ARTEMAEKITQVGAGIGLIVGGAVLIMPGLVILLQSAVAALVDAGIDDAWAALIVGGGIVVIGLVLLMIGMNRLKARRLLPNRTIEQVQRDASVAKQQMRKDDDSLQRAACTRGGARPRAGRGHARRVAQ